MAMPPILVTPFSFSNLVHPILPCHLQPYPLTPTILSIVLFLWLNGWSQHIWYTVLLNDNMDLHTSNLGTLVPEGPWCVFYATRCQLYWVLTRNVVFYWYSDLISHTLKHTLKHTNNFFKNFENSTTSHPFMKERVFQLCFSTFKLRKLHSLIEKIQLHFLYKKQLILAV